MIKENNTQIKDRFNLVLEDLKLNPNELAQKINMHGKTVYNYVNGDRKPSTEFIEKICTKFNISCNWLLLGEGQMYKQEPCRLAIDQKYYKIPVFADMASAGYGAIINEKHIEDYIMFSKEYINNELYSQASNIIIIKAFGDSMEPTINDEDLLIVDTSLTRPKEAFIYLIRIDDELVVKRLQNMGNGVFELIPDNKNFYKPIQMKIEDFIIVGRVIGYIRKFFKLESS